MVKLVVLELRKLVVPITITFICGLIFGFIQVYVSVNNSVYFHTIELWFQSYSLITFFFPLFITLPITWQMYSEIKHNYFKYSYFRVGKNRYIMSKWIAQIIFAFSISFSMSFATLIFTQLFSGSIKILDNSGDWFLHDFTLDHYWLYGFLASVWRGLIGTIFISMSFVLALNIKNIFIITLFPFAYYLLENYVFAILKYPFYRIVTSIGIQSSGISSSKLTAIHLITGPLLAISVIGIIVLYFKSVRKDQ